MKITSLTKHFRLPAMPAWGAAAGAFGSLCQLLAVSPPGALRRNLDRTSHALPFCTTPRVLLYRKDSLYLLFSFSRLATNIRVILYMRPFSGAAAFQSLSRNSQLTLRHLFWSTLVKVSSGLLYTIFFMLPGSSSSVPLICCCSLA
jgi:hypothetical protein